MRQTTQETGSVTIVDDDPAVRNSLRNLLESFGLRVRAFSSAEDFVTYRRASDGTCLILDIQLPGMNGLELQHHLSNRRTPISIIFITAHGEDNVREQALLDGAAAFLSKPVSSKELLDAVHSLLK